MIMITTIAIEDLLNAMKFWTLTYWVYKVHRLTTQVTVHRKYSAKSMYLVSILNVT